MNKILKVFLVSLIALFLLILVLPMLFKGKIENKIKDEVNNQVNAQVDYDHFSLSLLKSFPDIRLGIKGLSITGKDAFKQDTLVFLDAFSTEIDLLSAISGEVEIQSVLLNGLTINAKVLADSTANWDIALSRTDVVEEEQINDEDSELKIVLESFKINNANLNYSDEVNGVTSSIQDFNLDLSGDMSEKQTNLKLNSNINKVFVTYDNVNYINGASLALDSEIGADLENMIFTFLENELKVNRLVLKMDGEIAIKEDSYGLDLNVGTANTDFKSLLALIPEEYIKDFEGLNTSGTMRLDASFKGDYVDENNLPAFNVALMVENGMIQYPDLPESIQNINVNLSVVNPGGNVNQTITNLKRFHFELANNPFDATMLLSTPVSNPVFTGKVDGRIDLGSLVNAIPMDSLELSGVVEANFELDGNYAMVENENYDDINAQGHVVLDDFNFVSEDLPQGMLINTAKMTFNPKEIKLASFICKVGSSDFQLTGSLQNYLSYGLKNGVLKGKLNHYSKLINSNEFLMMASQEEEEVVEGSEESALVEVPKNIDFALNSKVDKLIYDKLEVESINGKVTIKDGIVKMDGLKMQMLDGRMVMAGQYNTNDSNKPFVDFKIDGKDLDLNKAAHSFSIVDSILPLAKNTIGKVSPKFTYYSELNKEAVPIMSTANGGGWLKSKSVEVSGSKIQNTLASTLNNDSYKTMKAEDLDINFIIEKGDVIIKPFVAKVGGKKVEVQGTQGLDQTIDYKITMPVSRKEVAKMAGLMGFNLPTSGDDLIVDMLVTGTVQEPSLGFDLEKAQKQIKKDLENEGEKLLKNLLKGF